MAYFNKLFFSGDAGQLNNSMLKIARFAKTNSDKEKLASYDGTWYAEHNGAISVKISQKLMEWGEFFTHS